MGHHDTEDQTASLTLTNCADKNLKLAEQATWSWKKNGGKSWKLWWYSIQVIKPPPWHWPIVLPGHLVSALWTWGGKQKIENGTHWYERIKLNGKLIILGNAAQWQERKIFWRSRTCSRRVGKDYRTLWLPGPDTEDHTLAYFFWIKNYLVNSRKLKQGWKIW